MDDISVYCNENNISVLVSILLAYGAQFLPNAYEPTPEQQV